MEDTVAIADKKGIEFAKFIWSTDTYTGNKGSYAQ